MRHQDATIAFAFPGLRQRFIRRYKKLYYAMGCYQTAAPGQETNRCKLIERSQIWWEEFISRSAEFDGGEDRRSDGRLPLAVYRLIVEGAKGIKNGGIANILTY